MQFSPIKLKIHRKNAKITQVCLAKKLGIHERTIQNWEGGNGQPSMTQAVKLISLLGLASMHSLMEEDE